MTLTDYDAVAIAEGFYDGPEEVTQDLQQEAWQHLIDTGLAWRLQGWFGRTAQHLINIGICHSTH